MTTLAKPMRIQRKRIKGWRKPQNTFYVGRGSAFGNPFRPGDEGISCNAQAVEAYVFWLNRHPEETKLIKTLRGKNLACWCSLDQPCHADVLLKIANE